jgi:hypothetical protein
MGCEHKAQKPGRAVPCVCVFSALTGAGAGPRGQCRLAACAGVPQGALPVRATCPGDRAPRGWIRIRSRILGSNH